MIKGVIFDFDGVIVESVDIKTNSFAKLFESEGEKAVKEIIDYHLLNSGVSRFEKFRYIYNNILKRELSDEIFTNLCNRFSELVTEEVIKAPFVKGAKEFLHSYKKAYAFFVSTATPQIEIEFIIRKRNIADYFRGIYGAPIEKSNIVERIIKDNNFLPQELVYIGDAISDYKAACANSVNFIARINNNEYIFDATSDCIKIKNLIGLNEIISEYC